MNHGVKKSLYSLYKLSMFVLSFVFLNHLLTRLEVPDWAIWYFLLLGVTSIYELGRFFRMFWLRHDKGMSEQIETEGGSG